MRPPTSCVTPMSIRAAFRPAISATQPQMSTARTHPTVPIEPIQPASEGVIVPELSGVAGDSSSSKFGDSQPMDKPYMSVARFAVEGEREKMKVLALIPLHRILK